MASALRKMIHLPSGISMPAIGFGTFQSETNVPPGTCKDAVLNALRLGVRHIDTALSYGIEDEVGEAILQSGIPRRELFVVTKLHQTFHNPQDVEVGIDTSLKQLGLDYVDLYLMHFPHAYRRTPEFDTLRTSEGKPSIDHLLSKNYGLTWAAMEALVTLGKTRAIGVSNFSRLKLRRLLETAKIHPDVNQVELHPYLPQHALLKFCKEKNIHLTAHSPLGGAPVGVVAAHPGEPGPIKDPLINRLTSKYNCTASQILLSWALQRGTSVVPKSINPERIALNTKALVLDQEDFEAVENLKDDGNSLRMNDPKNYIRFDIYNEEIEEPIGHACR